MFCAKCGNNVPDGTAFCPKCGNPMPRQVPQPQPYQQATPPQQAAPQQQVPYQQSPQPQPQPQPQPLGTPYQQPTPQPQGEPKKKRRWPIVVAISVVAAAAIAAVVVFVVLPRVMPKGAWVVSKMTSTDYSSDGQTTQTWSDTLDDRGNVIHELSEYAKSDGSYSSTLEYDYTFDENGFCQSESTKSTYRSSGSSDTSGTSNCDYQWTFGNDGKPTRLVRTETVGDSTYTYTYDFEYNSEGNISKRACKEQYRSVETESVLEFDNRGLLVKSTYKSDSDTSETNYNYEFDQAGKPIKSTCVTTNTTTGKKELERTSNYEYDENGNVKSSKDEYTSYSDDESDPTKSTVMYTYEYTYINNLSPWASLITHLYTVSTSNPY